jgi:hypothetical protein
MDTLFIVPHPVRDVRGTRTRRVDCVVKSGIIVAVAVSRSLQRLAIFDVAHHHHHHHHTPVLLRYTRVSAVVRRPAHATNYELRPVLPRADGVCTGRARKSWL